MENFTDKQTHGLPRGWVEYWRSYKWFHENGGYTLVVLHYNLLTLHLMQGQTSKKTHGLGSVELNIVLEVV